MRIVYIVPGPAGPFFEKNSLREQALVAELRWFGHDVLFLPLLFPLALGKDEGAGAEEIPVFGGAVRIYSHHCFPYLAEHAPEWLWRQLDKPGLRRRIAKHVLGSPRRFSEFIKDALDGRNGPLVAEMENLCQWLLQQKKPDIILLSTPFLLGMAAMLKNKLRVPVACAMNSEFEDIAHIRGPEGIILLTKLRSVVGDADGFLSISHFHAERIRNRLGVPDSAIRAVHPGLYIDNFPVLASHETPVVGVVVRGEPTGNEMNVSLAVSTLRRSVGAQGMPIRVAVERDVLHRFENHKSILEAGGKVETLPQTSEKLQPFLREFALIIFIHGSPQPAFDILVLDALACGIPVVIPNTGANPEIAAFSNAAYLYRDAAEMAEKTTLLLSNTGARADGIRSEARRSVEHCFSMPRLAQETAEALQTIINRSSRSQEAWAIRPRSASQSDSPTP